MLQQTAGCFSASLSVNDVAAKIADPQKWIEESAELAKQYAYAPPVSFVCVAVGRTDQ